MRLANPSTEQGAAQALEPVSAIIRLRRTNLRMDRDREVPTQVIGELVELATWAPNHKLTEPWRFAVLQGTARARLGQVTAEFQLRSGMNDEAKLEKTRNKFLRAPVVVLVATESSLDANPETVVEDRDAVAAAVQTFLLAATERGLASYWGSGAVCNAPEVRTLAGFADHASVIAAIYLGWPIGPVPIPARRPASVTWLDSSIDR
jgi:nitroreductase